MLAKLKTFGLDYNDFPTVLDNVALILRYITIDIYKNSKPISIIFYITTIIGSFGYFYEFVLSMFWGAFAYYGKMGRWDDVCLVLTFCFCTSTCVTKFVFMKLYSKEIKETVEKFLECDGHVIPDTRFAKTLRMRLRVVKKRAVTIWITLALNGVIYILLSFVTPGREFSYVIYGLVPMDETPHYELAMALNTVSATFCDYTLVSVAAFVVITVGYIESQMLSLSNELDNLWTDSQNFYDEIKNNVHAVDIKENIMNEFIRVRLRDIIKFHVANINLMHELEVEFRPTLAVEYAIVSLSIITELLAGLDKSYLQLPYSLIQVFMDCLSGQRLIEASNEFENALYNCKWQNFNVQNQKTVLIMLTMSQKTLTLSAGGITNLDFQFLMVVLKSTYSAYTTLKSTM